MGRWRRRRWKPDSLAMEVKIRHVASGDEHLDQKWLVIEGYIEGCPAVTKRVSMNTAVIASNPGHFEEKKAKLIADVEEYYVRYNAVQEQLRNL